MADEQLIQKQIGKQKSIGKTFENTAYAQIKHDKKKENVEAKAETIEIKETEQKAEEAGKKIEEKKPMKKETKIKKTEAFVYGKNVPISLKHAVAIGKFIKNFGIDEAIANLEKVRKKKLAVPFKGEIAHRKGKRLDGRSMAGGKYPVKASQHIIQLLKTLKANSSVNGLELENTKITEVIPNKASKQLHRFGSTRFKRIHIMIKAKESSLGKTSEKTNKNKEKKK